MNTELIGIIVTYLLTLLLAIPLGSYIARVFLGEKTWLDFLVPLEQGLLRICGIDAAREMNWKQHLVALLTINMLWFVWAMGVLLTQGSLPLNPDGNPSQTPDLAFNTAISFLVNCNLQHYSGETGLTYFSQLGVITFLQFVSAATGIAALVVVFQALRAKTAENLGNFFDILLKTCTRILLPLCLVIAAILAFNGTPTSFDGKDSLLSLQGDSVQVSRGPAAGMIAIKHLGTNGGGWFGVNSAHPLENPNYVTYLTEMVAQVIIPLAMIFALGYFLKRRKMAWIIYGVMTIGFLSFLVPTIWAEANGNPALSAMGIGQQLGNLEGKEMRFGAMASAYWSIVTTIISTGSVNSMHDSYMPFQA